MKSLSPLSLVVAAACVLAPSALRAEDTARVRITLTDGQVVEGDLLDHGTRRYKVRTADGVLDLAEDRVKKVEFTPGAARIDIDADDTLAEVIRRIGQVTKRTIVLAPELEGQKVSVSLRQIPWRDAVAVIGKMCRFDVEELGETLYLTHAPRVTLQFRNASVRTVLQLVGAYAGKSVVLGPGVAGTVSLDLRDTRYRVALQAFAYAMSLDLVERDSVSRLTRRAERPAPPRPDADSRAPERKQRVTLSLKDVTLEEAADRLSSAAQVNVLVDPDVVLVPGAGGEPSDKLSLELVDAPWRDAVALLARRAGCTIKEKAGVFLLRQAPKNQLTGVDVPAAAWFTALAHLAGRNVIVAPEVNGLLTVDLAGVFLEDAIEQTAQAYGYQVVEFPDRILVVTGRRFDPSAQPAGVSVGLERIPAAAAPAPKPLAPAERAQLEQEIEGQLSRLTAAVERKDVDACLTTFQDLSGLMRRYDGAGGEAVAAAMERWRKRLEPYGEIILSLKLQQFITRGNELLKAIHAAVQRKDTGAALVRHSQIEQLLAEMRREERDVFKRNAEALELRAKALLGHALGDAGILRVGAGATHRPHLEACLLSREQNLCVILGQVYRVGDPYLLPDGTEVEGAKVAKIARDGVTLRVAGERRDVVLGFEGAGSKPAPAKPQLSSEEALKAVTRISDAHGVSVHEFRDQQGVLQLRVTLPGADLRRLAVYRADLRQALVTEGGFRELSCDEVRVSGQGAEEHMETVLKATR
ncbi:MAG: hypothetical protein AB7N76_07170 [Planctomycetota bacterium]